MSSNELMMRLSLQMKDQVSGALGKMTRSTDISTKALKANRDQLRALEKQNGLIQKVKKEQEAFKRANVAMRENQANLIALKQSGSATAAQIKAQTALVKKSAASFDHQKRKLVELRQLAAQSGLKNLAQDERRLSDEIKRTTQTIGHQESALRRIDQLRAQRNRNMTIAGGMAATGVGITMLGRRGMNASRSILSSGFTFDTAMTGIQGNLGLQANDPALLALRERILNFNKEDSTALAGGLAALAQHGFKADQLAANIQPLLDMADSTRLSFEETANVVGSLMKGFGADAKDFAHITDVLVGAANRGGVPLTELQSALAGIAPTAKAAGLSLEQSAAMVAAMGRAGISATDAGTALNAVLRNLQNPNEKALAAIGIRRGSVGNIYELLEAISSKTSGMGEAKQLETLNSIFGAKSAAAMSALMGDMRSGNYGSTMAQLQTSQGAASMQAMLNTQDVDDKVNDLKAALSGIGTVFYEQNKDWLKELAISLTDVVNGITNWLKANPSLVSGIGKFFLIASMVLSVLGPIVTTLGGLLVPMFALKFAFGLIGIKGFGAIGMLKSLIKVFGLLARAVLTNPILLVIAAIAVGAYLVIKHWDKVKKFFSDLWGFIKDVFNRLVASAVAFGSGIWNQIKSAFDGGIAGVCALILNWSPIGLFYKVFAAVMSWFGITLPENFTEFGSDLIASLGNAIVEAGKSVLGWFTSIFESVFNWFTVDLPNAFSGFGRMMMDGLISGIKNAVGAVKDAIYSIGESVVNWFREKLHINSPSKVFMAVAESIPEGTAKGIINGLPVVEDASLALANEAQKGLPNFDGERFNTSSGGSVLIDSAPALSAGAAGPSIVVQGDTNTFIIQGGGNHAELMRMIRTEMDRREAEKMARARSAYRD